MKYANIIMMKKGMKKQKFSVMKFIFLVSVDTRNISSHSDESYMFNQYGRDRDCESSREWSSDRPINCLSAVERNAKSLILSHIF